MTLLFLIAIMALAVFFRFYQLEAIPPGLYPDVAVNGTNAVQTLQSGNYKVFYPDNNGREGLIIWLEAWTMTTFGISIWALKFPAAIIGSLTVWGVYLLSRQLFEKNRDAASLLAAFFTAFSFWHINFSRLGFRAIMVPFFIVFSFYFLWRAFKEKKVWPAVLAGIFFGLGFYTYISFRLAVPLLFCVFGLWLAYLWKNKKTFFKISLAMLVATFLTALPIGLYFLQNPADFFGRAAQTSIMAAPSPTAAGGISLLAHLAMFNFYGDQNWRHNWPPMPELFWPVGILFLIGIANAAKIAAGKRFTYAKLSFLTLLLWFGFLLLPGVLTSEGIPHSLRTIGAIPPVMIFCAAGGIYLYRWLQTKLPKKFLKILAAGFLVTVIAQSYWQYFIAWGKDPNTYYAFTGNLVEIANLTAEFNDHGYQTAVIVNEDGVRVPYPDGIPMPAQTIMFAQTAHCYKSSNFTDKKDYSPFSIFALPNELEQIPTSGKTIIVPMKNDAEIFNQLAQKYPQGQIKIKNNIQYYEIIE